MFYKISTIRKIDGEGKSLFEAIVKGDGEEGHAFVEAGELYDYPTFCVAVLENLGGVFRHRDTEDDGKGEWLNHIDAAITRATLT